MGLTVTRFTPPLLAFVTNPRHQVVLDLFTKEACAPALAQETGGSSQQGGGEGVWSVWFDLLNLSRDGTWNEIHRSRRVHPLHAS